jgi:hypothetical protein
VFGQIGRSECGQRLFLAEEIEEFFRSYLVILFLTPASISWKVFSFEMKTLFQIIVVIASIVLSNLSVRACSCADPSQREKFRRADVVFLGEIVESTYLNPIPKDSEFAQSARFVVKRQWKGPSQKEIRLLLSFDGPGTCGDMPLNVGLQYLVYAFHEKEGLVSYTDCGPNVLASSASADIKNLDRFWFRFWSRIWLF